MKSGLNCRPYRGQAKPIERLNPFEIRAELPRVLRGIQGAGQRLNPFEIRAELPRSRPRRSGAVGGLNPFEIRAELPRRGRTTSCMSPWVSIPLKSGLNCRAERMAGQMAACVSIPLKSGLNCRKFSNARPPTPSRLNPFEIRAELPPGLPDNPQADLGLNPFEIRAELPLFGGQKYRCYTMSQSL